MREFAMICRNCNQPFADSPRKVYCSDRCGRRAYQKRRRSSFPERQVWVDMKRRCSPKAKADDLPLYFGRGIRVCDRWATFAAFYEDMGPRPSAKHVIDRENNDGNYEPRNCRWATTKQSARNSRRNTLITVYGFTFPLAFWAEVSPASRKTIVQRLHSGWSATEAVFTPPAPVGRGLARANRLHAQKVA